MDEIDNENGPNLNSKEFIPEDDGTGSDSSEESVEDQPESAIAPALQTGRKRLRRTEMWKRQKAKKLRNSGKKYLDRNGNVHDSRKVREHNHNCRYKCNTNVPEEKRKIIFNDFWKLASWELQTSFLNGTIELETVKRKKPIAVVNKAVSCIYKLGGVRVCKEFFIKTLDVSNKRLQNVVKNKKEKNSGVSSRDNRGRKEPSNKIDQESIDIINAHINKFPRYVSHYSRDKTPNCKYLDPTLNLKIMYKLYIIFCQEEKFVEPVKESFYRHIFKTKFNLSFHRPLTDTCVTCDKLRITMENGDDKAKEEARFQKELHLRKVEATKQAKDEWRNNSDDSQVAICFDLQKTMPTPHVSNTKAYYLRQLWTYNLNVHNLQSGNAFMYTWHEGQASRGCKEIASCLLKFIGTLPRNVRHITAFSDNCGGQNKSHIIVKFWLYIIRNTYIETVDHRFLISGHSYNECDRDFGLIEIKKKRQKRDLYVPDHWSELIASASRNFVVIRMRDEDFVNLDCLGPYFRKNVPEIRQMQWLHFEKKSPYTLFYKKHCSGGTVDFYTLQMKSSRAGRNTTALPNLPVETEKPKLKYTKFANLIELLPFVPPIYHDFYKNLRHHERLGRPNLLVDVEHDQEEDPDEVYNSDED